MAQVDIWEDDQFVYVPEEFLRHFPKEYREAAQAVKVQGEELFQVADEDLKVLVRLLRAVPTTASLSYIYHQLRAARFEVTTKAYLEQDVLTTAFVVTYGRLFAKGSGTSGFSPTNIPKHLRFVHDEIIELRNKRYAHNGLHDSVSSALSLSFDGAVVRIQSRIALGSYVGGRGEWAELIAFIDAEMHERLMAVLRRLRERTGYDWKFPTGEKPDWVGDNG